MKGICPPQPDRYSMDGFKRYLFHHHQVFCLVMTLVTTCAGMVLWAWDIVHDGAGAAHTLWLRILILPTALPYLVTLARARHPVPARFAALVTLLGWEAEYIAVLNRLDGSALYGTPGFIAFLLMPLLLTRGFHYGFNALLVAAIATLPPLLHALGVYSGFDIAQYASTVTPALIIAFPALYFQNAQYRRFWHHTQSTEREARTDPLTGMANRRDFDEVLQRLSDPSAPFIPSTLLLLDIDQFKSINDDHGHGAGDSVLRILARICRQSVRGGDLVARIGGDEIAIVLEGAPLRIAEQVAERIREQTEHRRLYSRRDRQIQFTVSIGIAVHPGRAQDWIDQADTALYQAKRLGGNRIHTYKVTQTPRSVEPGAKEQAI